jgi:hypothetical protein
MNRPTAPPDGVLSAMAKDHFEMVVALATAMSIATDLDVQSKLRLVANAVEGRPFLVTRHNSQVWLEIGKGHPRGARSNYKELILTTRPHEWLQAALAEQVRILLPVCAGWNRDGQLLPVGLARRD